MADSLLMETVFQSIASSVELLNDIENKVIKINKYIEKELFNKASELRYNEIIDKQPEFAKSLQEIMDGLIAIRTQIDQFKSLLADITKLKDEIKAFPENVRQKMKQAQEARNNILNEF